MVLSLTEWLLCYCRSKRSRLNLKNQKLIYITTWITKEYNFLTCFVIPKPPPLLRLSSLADHSVKVQTHCQRNFFMWSVNKTNSTTASIKRWHLPWKSIPYLQIITFSFHKNPKGKLKMGVYVCINHDYRSYFIEPIWMLFESNQIILLRKFIDHT